MPEFYAKAVLALVALAVAGSPRVGTGGVTVTLPSGWHSTTPDQGRVVQPRTRLVVSSGPIHSDLTSRCQAQIAGYAFPRKAVAIVVVEWVKPIGGTKIGVGPRRPHRFTAANLPVDRRLIECFDGLGNSIQWAERGHTFGAYVLLGRRAPAALAARARSVLDTLRVASQ